jgi:hypothetical protein
MKQTTIDKLIPAVLIAGGIWIAYTAYLMLS